MKLPDKLTIQMTELHPRYICSVSDGRGTTNGGFWKGFATHAAMWTWLEKHGYKGTTYC